MRPPCNPAARVTPCPAQRKCSEGPHRPPRRSPPGPSSRCAAAVSPARTPGTKPRFSYPVPARASLFARRTQARISWAMAMQAPLDELLEAWQRHPDERTALSLCEELELSRNRELID